MTQDGSLFGSPPNAGGEGGRAGGADTGGAGAGGTGGIGGITDAASPVVIALLREMHLNDGRSATLEAWMADVRSRLDQHAAPMPPGIARKQVEQVRRAYELAAEAVGHLWSLAEPKA